MLNNRVKCYIFGIIALLGVGSLLSEGIRLLVGGDMDGRRLVFELLGTAIFFVLWRNYRRAVRQGNLRGRVYRKIW